VAFGESLFEPLLERRRHAERDRNALNVLTSYKFLFNLPQRCAVWPRARARVCVCVCVCVCVYVCCLSMR
jgi:hypothetical protein